MQLLLSLELCERVVLAVAVAVAPKGSIFIALPLSWMRGSAAGATKQLHPLPLPYEKLASTVQSIIGSDAKSPFAVSHLNPTAGVRHLHEARSDDDFVPGCKASTSTERPGAT